MYFFFRTFDSARYRKCLYTLPSLLIECGGWGKRGACSDLWELLQEELWQVQLSPSGTVAVVQEVVIRAASLCTCRNSVERSIIGEESSGLPSDLDKVFSGGWSAGKHGLQQLHTD